MNDTTKRAALTVATLVSFLGPFMGAAANIALPTIGKNLNLDAVVLSWVATSYLLASAMFLVPFGRIADIYGRKKVFTYGIILFTISSLGCAVSTFSAMLIFSRVLQGIGSSMIFGTGMAILISVYPPQERGKVIGINVAAVYLGLSMGPFLGGFLTQHLGWRSIFFMNIPLGIIVIIVTMLQLKGEWAEAKGEKLDITGSIIYSLMLVALIYGLSQLPQKKGFFLIAAGFAGLIGFILFEMNNKNPVLNINIFRHNPAFAFSNLAALINYGATFAVGFLLSLYLQYLKGLTPQQAGFVLVCQPIVMTIFSPLAGRLSDRIEPRIIASTGMAFTTIGLFILTTFNENTRLGLIICSLIILGFGLALFSSPNTNAIMSSVERRFYGVASAMVGTMRTTGMMISMGVAMLLFALFIGRVQITPEYYPSFLKSVRAAFIIFTILCFIGIFASLARGRLRNEK
ncbi:MAG: MFS transporter [bacterium]